MGKKVIEEKISIDQNTSGITQSNGTAAVLSNIYSYTVPDRSVIVLNPTDFLALYLDTGTGSTEAAKTNRCQLVIEDPMGRRTNVAAEGQYTIFKEFQDATMKYYIGKRVVIPANFVIKVKVNAAVVLVVAYCYLNLSCTLIYETLD